MLVRKSEVMFEVGDKRLNEGSTVGGVAQADKTVDRGVRLPDCLCRLEYSYDKNVETKLDSKADNAVVSR